MPPEEIPFSDTPIFAQLARELGYERLVEPKGNPVPFFFRRVPKESERTPQSQSTPPVNEPSTEAQSSPVHHFTPAPKPFLIEDGVDNYEE